jgi:hypothetical protein
MSKLRNWYDIENILSMAIRKRGCKSHLVYNLEVMIVKNSKTQFVPKLKMIPKTFIILTEVP